jgi:hypothetical protein
MQGQVDASAATPIVEYKRCSADSCAEHATAEFQARPLCLTHFVRESASEIESRNRQLQGAPWNTAAVAVFRELLANCSTQARELLDSQELSPSPLKDQLLNLLLLTSQMSQRLRRSPRVSKSVLVWLRREDPGQTWEEETWTCSISRHGAGLACRHRVETGQTVYLCRKDKGGRARARIVYSHFDAAGDRQIGIELLDREDFWDAPELERAQEAVKESANQRVPESPPSSATIRADLEIHVGSRTTRYNNVAFEVTTQESEARLSGTIPDTLSDLKIDPASLRALSADSKAPVRIELTWRKKKK